MNDDLFGLLCAALGHDPSSVRVIRLSPGRAGVSWTEASGMPRSTVYELGGLLADEGRAQAPATPGRALATA